MLKKCDLKIALCYLVTLLFVSCASTKKVEEKKLYSPVYVTNTKAIQLLPPECMVGEIDSLQLLTVSFGEQGFSFLTYVFVDDKGIQLSILNDFGTDVGELIYDGNKVELTSAVIPESLKGEYIIADIQNAHYNLESLVENYKKAGLIFEETILEDSKIRTILNGKKVVEQITIFENSITIQNYLRGYMYNLTVGEE